MRVKKKVFSIVASLLLLVTFIYLLNSRSNRKFSKEDLSPFIEKLNSAKHRRSSNPAQKHTLKFARDHRLKLAALNAIGMELRDVRLQRSGEPESVFSMLSHLGGFGEIVWVDSWTNFQVNLSSNDVPRRIAVRAALDAIGAAGGTFIDAGNGRHLIVKKSERQMYDAAIQALGWRDGKEPPWNNNADANSLRDAKLSEKLPGIWHEDFSDTPMKGYTNTFTIAANGDFVIKGVDPEGIPVHSLSGTLKVEDGFLIQTITNTTQPNAIVPQTFRARIISLNGKELVFGDKGARINTVLDRVTP